MPAVWSGGTLFEVCVIQRVRLGGACGPPPPFVAPLVPRCALTSGATPRVRAGRRLRSQLASTRRAREGHGEPETCAMGEAPFTRGVGAGRSAQRGTSGATTGPRGARSAPPNPDAPNCANLLELRFISGGAYHGADG